MSFRIELSGEGEVLEALEDLFNQSVFDALIGDILVGLRSAAQSVTPVLTGSLRDAWVVEGTRLGIDGAAYNSLTGRPVSEYADKVLSRVGVGEVVQGKFIEVAEQEARKYGFV